MTSETQLPDKPTIIIADDRRTSRHLIHSILEPEGYNLLEAKNGKEAIELCQTDQPDLLLLDIVMPVMSGLEACRVLNKEGNKYLIPVLMFTAHNDGSEVEKSFQAGASDFINKPINPDELRHRVKRLLHLRYLEIKRQTYEKELQANYDKIQYLSRKVLSAYEEEKARLARELHDEVGMSLTTLKLNLQLFSKDLTKCCFQHKEKLDTMVETVSELQSTIRSKAYFLRPPALNDLGLVAVINNMIAELSKYAGIKGKLEASGSPDNISVEIENALYRCIQESLTNVARHANADNVLVKIDFVNNSIRVNVVDDGIGFEQHLAKSDNKHLGLQGMQERVDLLNGSLDIKSDPDQGTNVQIIIPLV
jgi:signal transduction histidine kinase